MKVFGVDVVLNEPLNVANLTLFPILGDDRPLPPVSTVSEALDAGLLQVSELDEPEVPTLSVSNAGEIPVLLVEGECLLGGHQNRTLDVTVLVPPKSVIEVPVSCVERGRWGAGEPIVRSRRHSPSSIRSAKIRELQSELVGRRGQGAQATVWRTVDRQAAVHGVESPTSALEDIQVTAEAALEDRLEDLQAVPGQIGALFSSGDDVLGLDLFDRPSLFSKYMRAFVSGYLMDATDRPSSSTAKERAEAFLASLGTASARETPACGLGEEFHIDDPVLAGVGLRYLNSLLHLSAFPVTC